MKQQFKVSLTHGFFTLTRADIENPYADWTDSYIDQGFVWMPGSISFYAPGNPIGFDVTVEMNDTFDGGPAEEAMRVIRLPFDVSEGVDVILCTIVTYEPFQLPGGPHMVQFEYWGDDEQAFARLRFCPGTGEAQILKQDALMKPPPRLLLDGKPV